jgi:hypothetical protein
MYPSDLADNAALKLSRGDLTGLRDAVELVNIDWRDLLLAAGFADDTLFVNSGYRSVRG